MSCSIRLAGALFCIVASVSESRFKICPLDMIRPNQIIRMRLNIPQQDLSIFRDVEYTDIITLSSSELVPIKRLMPKSL